VCECSNQGCGDLEIMYVPTQFICYRESCIQTSRKLLLKHETGMTQADQEDHTQMQTSGSLFQSVGQERRKMLSCRATSLGFTSQPNLP